MPSRIQIVDADENVLAEFPFAPALMDNGRTERLTVKAERPRDATPALPHGMQGGVAASWRYINSAGEARVFGSVGLVGSGCELSIDAPSLQINFGQNIKVEVSYRAPGGLSALEREQML